MKYKIHLPTEQYGFIELEIENDEAIDAVITKIYRDLKAAWNKKEEDKKAKVANTMRAKEIANPIDHIDVTLEELPINE